MSNSVSEKDRAKARRILLRQVQTGGVLLDRVLAALKALDPEEIPAYMLPRALDTAAAVSLAALAGLAELDATEAPVVDPWTAVAEALSADEWPGAPAPVEGR